MIVDFHNHVFPDHIAERAMAELYEGAGGLYQPVHDGTLAGLLANMDDAGVDMAVVLPVITKPSQAKGVNEWAAGICSERIVSFGAVHPQSDDYRRDIDQVVGLGLKGLKFHAEYQGFVLDDPQMLRIYDYAFDHGLIVMHHGGYDPAFSSQPKTSPRQFLNVAQALPGGVLVAAHLGGHGQWDEVEALLAGSDVYLDTSMGFGYYPTELFMRIVERHGAGKLLFATDSPWSDVHAELAALGALPLAEEQRQAIVSGNALRLLGIG
jgi:predicted TIM-barrel fold metal-dependent hydrolase